MKDVLYITTPERVMSHRWEPKSSELSSKLEVLSIDELVSNGKGNNTNIFPLGVPEVNTIYIKDPISNLYYPSTEAEDRLTRSKEQAIDHIASLLGVKKIVRRVSSASFYSRECDVNGKISCKYAKLDAGIRNEHTERINRRHELTREYETGAIDYESANAYAKKTGLISDQFVNDLLQSRHPSNHNKLSKYREKMELTSEVNDLQEAAFSLSVLGGLFRCGAKYKESISQKTSITLEYEMMF